MPHKVINKICRFCLVNVKIKPQVESLVFYQSKL